MTRQSHEHSTGDKVRRAVTGTLLGTLGVTGLAACSTNEAEAQPAPSSDVTVSTEATPEAEATSPTPETPSVSPTDIPSEEPTETVEVEVTTESLRIPADLPAEELAQASSDLWQAWAQAGTDADSVATMQDRLYEIWHDYNGDYDVILDAVARENAGLYTTALLADNWADDPNMVRFYEDTVAANAHSIEVSQKRFVTNEPLIEVTTIVSDVVELDAHDGQRIIQFVLREEATNSDFVAPVGTVTRTFDITDGTARLIASSTALHN